LGCDHQLPTIGSPAIASATLGTGPRADASTTPCSSTNDAHFPAAFVDFDAFAGFDATADFDAFAGFDGLFAAFADFDAFDAFDALRLDVDLTDFADDDAFATRPLFAEPVFFFTVG
jgi:hypothetical protein